MSNTVEHYQQLLDSIGDGVYFVDTERRITFWNKGAEVLSGFSAQEMVGENCFSHHLSHIDQDGKSMCGTKCPLLATIKDGIPRTTHIYMRHHDGHRQPVQVKAVAFRDETGAIVGATEVFQDDAELVTVRLQLTELEQQALTDPLTGIGNRRHFYSVLENCLTQWDRHQSRFGLLMVDVDHFKEINDDFGHDNGDAALQTVATSLRYGLRSLDVVSRYGGDEFVCLIHVEDDEALRRIGERMRFLVRNSTIPMPGDLSISLSVSVGGALVQPGDTAESLTIRADRQLYLCKGSGRDRVAVGLAENTHLG